MATAYGAAIFAAVGGPEPAPRVLGVLLTYSRNPLLTPSPADGLTAPSGAVTGSLDNGTGLPVRA